MIILIADCLADYKSSRRKLAKGLKDNGYKVLVVIYGEDDSPDGDYFGCKSLLKWFKIIYPIRKEIELIDSYKFAPNLLNSISSIMFPYYVVININGLGRYFAYKKFNYKRIIYILIYKFISSRSNTIYLQNTCDRKKLRIPESNKVRIISGSGIRLPMSLNCEKRDRIIFVGRLLRSKGVLYAIDLVRELNKYSSTIRFEIYGSPDNGFDGISKSEILDYIDGDDNIVYEGYSDDLNKVFKETDLLIYPSVYGEGFPRVVLEALSNGSKAAIGPFCDWQNLLVPDVVVGLTLEKSKDVKILQRIISAKRTSQNQDSLMSILEKYSFNNILNKKLRLYEEAIAKNI